MTKKKILKRAFAVFAIVVVLASMLLPFGASAVISGDAFYTIYDIPFYNYVAFSGYNTTYNDGRNAYIETINVLDGYFVASADIKQQGAVYIPTSYLKVTLRQAMPDAQVGRTYYLNVNSSAYYLDGGGYWHSITDESWGYVVPYFDLMLDGQRVGRWEFGQPLTLTQEMLDAYIYIFPYRVTSDDLIGKTIKVSWQPWVNNTPNQKFVSYYHLAEMLDNYSYEAGRTDAYEEFSGMYSYLSSANARSLQLEYYNDTLFHSYVDFTSNFQYAFNGYSWFSNRFDASMYANIPNGYTANDLRAIKMFFDFDEHSVQYALGSSPLILYAQNAVVRVYLFTEPYGPGTVSRWYEHRADSGSVETVDITNLFNIASGSAIYAIKIEVYGLHQEPYAYSDTIWYGGVSMSQRGIEYNVGFDDGYAAAELENDRAYDRGYTKGNDDGYWRGRGDEQKESGFFSLISAVIDAPIQAFKGLFGFNVMGVDMSAFMLSIITLCLFIAVIKLVI